MTDIENHSDLQIVDKEYGLPFSKGLMAQSIMATGLPPERAYQLAREVESHLLESGDSSISLNHLQEIAQQVLGEEEGQSFTERYRRWRLLGDLEKPIIILVSGATGVGKSTLATQIAHRLGVTRLTSSDSVREVMRAFFSPELMPAIHYSSFEAGKSIKPSAGKGPDQDLAGFVDQVEKVSVGINAIIERAIRERTRMVLEGAHIVPGFLKEGGWSDAIVIQMVLMVKDIDSHKGHFFVRDQETQGLRSLKKYLNSIDKIRRVQDFLVNRALEAGVPVIDNQNIDDVVNTAMDIVLDAVNRYQQAHLLRAEAS